MPDTKRNLAALIALWLDNTSELIGAEDGRDMLVSMYQQGFGSIRTKDGSTQQTATTTPTKLINWLTVGLSEFTIPSIINSQIGLTEGGTFQVFCGLFIDPRLNARLDFEFYLDGVATGISCAGQGTAFPTSMMDFLSAADGQILTVRVNGDGGNDDFTMVRGQMLVKKVGN
jgi:hypothetical protein